MKCITLSWLATFAALVLLSTSAAAQEAPASVEVTLVAAPGLPSGAPTLVMHRRQARPRDVVLLDLARATPEDLAASLTLLATLRAQFGDVPSTDVQAVPGTFTPSPAFPQTDRPRLAGYLRSLGSAPPRRLEQLGAAPAITVSVPGLRVRRAAGPR